MTNSKRASQAQARVIADIVAKGRVNVALTTLAPYRAGTFDAIEAAGWVVVARETPTRKTLPRKQWHVWVTDDGLAAIERQCHRCRGRFAPADPEHDRVCPPCTATPTLFDLAAVGGAPGMEA